MRGGRFTLDSDCSVTPLRSESAHHFVGKRNRVWCSLSVS